MQAGDFEDQELKLMSTSKTLIRLRSARHLQGVAVVDPLICIQKRTQPVVWGTEENDILFYFGNQANNGTGSIPLRALYP